LRLILLLAIAGAALAGIGAMLAQALDPQRRILRYLRQALGAEPQGALVDRSQGRGMAFNIEAAKVSVLWDGGRRGLIYRLEQLVGGEMMVDHRVIASVYRDAPPKRLEDIPASAHKISLRLVFDAPSDPEFELELWPARHGRNPQYRSPAEATQAGRKWLASLEAILRKPKPRTLTKPAPLMPPDEDEPPWDDEED
jgi:hypothetical protein